MANKNYKGKGQAYKIRASASSQKQNKDNQEKKNDAQIKTNKETVKDTNKETNTETRKIESGSVSQNKKQENQNKQNENKQKPIQTKSDKARHAIGAIILIGTTLIVGGLAAVLGGKMQDGLVKPPAYPPEWLFPMMWSIFYVALGIAAYLAYFSVKDKKKRTGDLICYGIHLFFNLFWTLFYFRLNMLIFATIWLLMMIITAIIVTYRYIKANVASGIIFIVYSLWLIYAMYLSLGITILNLK